MLLLMLEQRYTREFLAKAVRYSSPVKVLTTQADTSVAQMK